MCNYAKLHAMAFGFAWGILGAVSLFFMGLFAMGGHATAYVTMVSSVFVGFGGTFLGSILGAVWGFLDGFIMGVLTAWLYNMMLCCACMCKCKMCQAGEGKECGTEKK